MLYHNVIKISIYFYSIIKYIKFYYTILPFSEIQIPLNKVAEYYQTTAEHIDHLFGKKITDGLAFMADNGWIKKLENYLIDVNKN